MLTTARRARTTRDRDEGGFSLALMALFLVSMLGMAGLVVDLGSWQVQASRIQQAADAAALAGVVRLPDGFSAAEARALEVASDNGYRHSGLTGGDPDVTVTVTSVGEETLEVTVRKQNVPQYFAQVVRSGTTNTITRRSTAQYVQPVPLGSPRNYLGTRTLPIGVTGDGIENFYLAISGECTRREYGDRITPRAMNNFNGPHSCTAGTGGTLANPEHDDRGYLFGVNVPTGNGAVDLQMYDAPTCTDGSGVNITQEDRVPFPIVTTVRRQDDLNPYAGSLVAGSLLQPNPRTFAGLDVAAGECAFNSTMAADGTCGLVGGLRECWTTIATLPGPGDYSLQVNPTFVNDNTGHTNFALRAKPTGSSFVACTSDANALAFSPPYSAQCNQVYGLQHLPIVARGNNSPRFFLASIDSRHNGKTMEVTLYDSAEGATGISLVNPIGGLVPVDWQVLCANGDEPDAGTCNPAEVNPDGGRSNSGPPVTTVNVAGNGTQPFTNNVQTGRYSDRLLRLTYKLPQDITTAYSGKTWWKIEYQGDFGGDRTTWSVRLLGDPVRLIPNS